MGLQNEKIAALSFVTAELNYLAPPLDRPRTYTFDDLPAHGPLPPGETRIEVANQVIRALKKAHVPPTYGFVNGVLVQQQPFGRRLVAPPGVQENEQGVAQPGVVLVVGGQRTQRAEHPRA